MDIKKEYERWLAKATADADVAAELKTLDDAKIEDAFYRDLANIWPVLMPVPTVSFATRYLHTSAGVMVTASHNPSRYNGYKVYAAHHAGVPGRHQGVRRQEGHQTAGLCAGSGWSAEAEICKSAEEYLK